MDWNWYFGALAQSAAAIVGIFGAFVITKILNNQATFSQKLNRARELLAGCHRVVDAADDLAINWYNTRVIEDELEDLEKLLNEDDTKKPEEYYDQLRFPIFYERERAIQAIRLVIDRRRQKLERERKKAELRAGDFLGSVSFPGPVVPHIPHMHNASLFAQVQKEREAIDTVIRDARHQIRLVEDFLDSARGNPESSPQITVALILVTVLFYFGVIYPLSFLPASPDGAFTLSIEAFLVLMTSLKGILLGIVSIVFTAILVMFFGLNLRLRYSPELLSQLSEFDSLSAYSEYFNTMEKNQRAGSAAHDG